MIFSQTKTAVSNIITASQEGHLTSASLGNLGLLRELGRGASAEVLLSLLTLNPPPLSFFGTIVVSSRASLRVGAAMLDCVDLRTDVLGSLDF